MLQIQNIQNKTEYSKSLAKEIIKSILQSYCDPAIVFFIDKTLKQYMLSRKTFRYLFQIPEVQLKFSYQKGKDDISAVCRMVFTVSPTVHGHLLFISTVKRKFCH